LGDFTNLFKQNFFIKIHDLLREDISNEEENKIGEETIRPALEKAQKDTYEALCDSFNTRLVMQSISDLVSAFNSTDRTNLKRDDIIASSKWITEMVNIFGLNGDTLPTSDTIGWSGSSIPEDIKPYVYPISKVRDELRRKARSTEGINKSDLLIASTLDNITTQKSNQAFADIASSFTTSINQAAESSNLSKSVLELCDKLRDVDLWEQGIYLEDGLTPDTPAIVRPVTRELQAARDERDKQRDLKQKAKEEREKKAAEEAAAKAEKGKLSHLEMFRTSEYSAWDEEGLPLKDAEGKEVAKSRMKKLKKDWEKQKKLHEAWLSNLK
jgi:cysteinyl-tRNA synthetase